MMFDCPYLIYDTIKLLIGLVSTVISDPRKRNEQDILPNTSPDMATENMTNDIKAEVMTTTASRQRM